MAAGHSGATERVCVCVYNGLAKNGMHGVARLTGVMFVPVTDCRGWHSTCPVDTPETVSDIYLPGALALYPNT